MTLHAEIDPDRRRLVAMVDRPVAVAQIADHIATRTHYLIPIGPNGAGLGLHATYRGIAADTLWLDNGIDTILRLQPHAQAPPAIVATLLTELALLAPMAVVMAAPKTPANTRAVAALAQLNGQAVDEQQDLIVGLSGARVPIEWPRLFVDAIAQVDPAAAAQIYAHDLAGLS